MRHVRSIVALFVLTVFAAGASAQGPSFMPGFPLRAGTNVMLMWMPAPGATSYNVYRSETPAGPYEKIATIPANNHMDPNVPQSKTYYYVVKPVIGGSEGASSPEVVIKGIEPMKAPAMGGHLVTEDYKIVIRWENIPRAAFYNVFRSEAERGEVKLVSSVQDVRYTDSKVSVGKTYYYQVSAVDSGNVESPKSDRLVVKLEERKAAPTALAEVFKPVSVVDFYDSSDNVVLRGPGDITVDGEGNFYVTDGTGVIQVVNKDFKFVRFIGGTPPAGFTGNWARPSGLFFDRKNRELYACFPDASAVRVFNPEGALLRSYTLGKPDPKTAPRLAWEPAPIDVALGADGTVWIIDGFYFQLVGLNQKGEEVKRIGLPREHPDREKTPEGVIYTPGFVFVNPTNGEIGVVEVSAQRVSVFDKAGKFVRHVGGRGMGAGGFQIPNGIAVDDQGRMYVGDRNLEKVQVFGADGKYLHTFNDPRKNQPDQQVRIAQGLAGVAVNGDMIYCSNLIRERVTVYKIAE